MQKIKLSARLEAVASLVGRGSVADIGTDHAKLPVYLVQNGHPKALASDIKEGPCRSARANIYKWGLHGKIEVVCAPGLDAVGDFKPDNIVIAGMGGEMIASILEASDYHIKTKCPLVLQPQSMQDVLRRFLAENGYVITAESVVLDGGKYYQVIAARYDGESRRFTDTEYKLGALNLERCRKAPTAADTAWLKLQLEAAKKRVSGREDGHDDSPEQMRDRELISDIEEILK